MHRISKKLAIFVLLAAISAASAGCVKGDGGERVRKMPPIVLGAGSSAVQETGRAVEAHMHRDGCIRHPGAQE